MASVTSWYTEEIILTYSAVKLASSYQAGDWTIVISAKDTSDGEYIYETTSFTVTEIEATEESCSDGILNQDETEIDCGGSICDACASEESSDDSDVIYTSGPCRMPIPSAGHVGICAEVF
jgi:hypothetical protein